MLFSQSVALSILAALGANAMIIPNIGDVVDVFKNTDLSQFKEDVKEEAKNVGSTVSSAVADYESKLSSKLGPLLQNPRELIPHKYIVVFKNDVTPESVQFHQEWVAAKHSEHVAQADSSDPFFATISDASLKCIE